MSGLVFDISNITNELQLARRIAGDFLQNPKAVFQELEDQLDFLRTNYTNGTVAWEIDKQRPIRTVERTGEYEPGKGGSETVFGELSSKWEIKRVHPKAKKTYPASQFEVVGIASTVARIFRVGEQGEDNQLLTTWRTEIGLGSAPGCSFHIQLGEDVGSTLANPLPVPRLPSIIATPAAALEFLLAELFQDDWKTHLTSEPNGLQAWRSIQKERFRRLLNWQLKHTNVESGSPWSRLKREMPAPDMFVAP